MKKKTIYNMYRAIYIYRSLLQAVNNRGDLFLAVVHLVVQAF